MLRYLRHAFLPVCAILFCAWATWAAAQDAAAPAVPAAPPAGAPLPAVPGTPPLPNNPVVLPPAAPSVPEAPAAPPQLTIPAPPVPAGAILPVATTGTIPVAPSAVPPAMAPTSPPAAAGASPLAALSALAGIKPGAQNAQATYTPPTPPTKDKPDGGDKYMFYYSKGTKTIAPLKKSKSKKSESSTTPAAANPALGGGMPMGVGMAPMGMGMGVPGMATGAVDTAQAAQEEEDEEEENLEILREAMTPADYKKRKDAEITRWTQVYKDFLLGNYSAHANDPVNPISAQEAMEMMSGLDQQTLTDLQTFSPQPGLATGVGMSPGMTGMPPTGGDMGMMMQPGTGMMDMTMMADPTGGAGGTQRSYRDQLAEQMAHWTFYYEQLHYWNKYVEQKILCRELEEDEQISYDAVTHDEDMKTLLATLTKKAEELSKEQKESYEEMVGAVKENEINQTNYEEWMRQQEQAVTDFAQRWAALYRNAGLKIDGVTYVVRSSTEKPASGEKDVLKESLPSNAVLLEVPSKKTITPYDLINADGTVKKPAQTAQEPIK